MRDDEFITHIEKNQRRYDYNAVRVARWRILRIADKCHRGAADSLINLVFNDLGELGEPSLALDEIRDAMTYLESRGFLKIHRGTLGWIANMTPDGNEFLLNPDAHDEGIVRGDG